MLNWFSFDLFIRTSLSVTWYTGYTKAKTIIFFYFHSKNCFVQQRTNCPMTAFLHGYNNSLFLNSTTYYNQQAKSDTQLERTSRHLRIPWLKEQKGCGKKAIFFNASRLDRNGLLQYITVRLKNVLVSHSEMYNGFK